MKEKRDENQSRLESQGSPEKIPSTFNSVLSGQIRKQQKALKLQAMQLSNEKKDFETFGNTMTMSIASEDFDKERQKNLLSRPKEFLKLLQQNEAEKFGDRMADGYIKIDILGKGGKAIVWLGIKGEEKFAVK
jgi:hypothetical protein